MSSSLLIRVHLMGTRYHGSGEWPPAPARLFQALVAGAARGSRLDPGATDWLTWLERLPPPVIGAPRVRLGSTVVGYVPNNDLDAVRGDPRLVSDIRVAKTTRPRLLEGHSTFLYAWKADEGAPGSSIATKVVHQLYQFGRGIDMAWAEAQWLEHNEAGEQLAAFDGVLYHPTPGGGDGLALACALPGSLQSLRTRFQRTRERFRTTNRQVLFRQPPKAHWTQVLYAAPPSRFLYELRSHELAGPLGRRPLAQAARFTAELRDLALERLQRALPSRADQLERTFRNRDPGVPGAPRIRILPLPSIGHSQADPGIRRVLVEVPAQAPVMPDDVAWAFSGLVAREHIDEETGEIRSETLVATGDQKMRAHYAAEDGRTRGHLRWQTITAAVLPAAAARRRIDPAQRGAEAKGGREYASELRAARDSVVQAIRHAGIRAHASHIVLQRDPFSLRGARAEAFAEGTRFDKRRLWHVEILFDRPILGPVAIGDGRFTGLGLMQPVPQPEVTDGLFTFSITEGLAERADPRLVSYHLRRAVMARVQTVLGEHVGLPAYFHGHAPDSSPLEKDHSHLYYQADLQRRRVVILAPHILNRRAPSREEKHWLETLEVALAHFNELAAGPAGKLTISRQRLNAERDPLLSRAKTWTSTTRYTPCRHHNRMSPEEAILADARNELVRRKLPTAAVEVLSVHRGRRGGLSGTLVLSFRRAVPGPIVLGRDCHRGGGLFERAEPPSVRSRPQVPFPLDK